MSITFENVAIVGKRDDPRVVEVILRESAEVVRSRGSFIIGRTTQGHVLGSAGVDRSNQDVLRRLGPMPEGQVLLFRSLDAVAEAPDVPDPWGHGMDAFAEVFDILDRTMPRLLEHVRTVVPAG